MPTNYNYNQTIPFATNKPSVDQPNMETNTNSIFSIIGTDHLTFNTATGNQTDGMHTVVHFANQTVDPAAIGTIGELYCKQVTQGIYTDECLFYQSGGGRITQLTGILLGVSGNQTLAAANGYTVLPGGIIMQWGTSSVNVSGSSTTITFPITFPTNLFSITIGCINTQGNSPSENNVYIKSASQSTGGFKVTNSSSGGLPSIYWMAIGN